MLTVFSQKKPPGASRIVSLSRPANNWSRLGQTNPCKGTLGQTELGGFFLWGLALYI
jgi:hypothetical protein